METRISFSSSRKCFELGGDELLRKTGWILSWAAIGLFSVGMPAWGAFAGSDLIEIPTGDVLRVNQWDLGLHGQSDGPLSADFRMGLAPGWELGIDAIEDHGAGINIKYQLLSESKEAPALAVGIADIGRDDLSPYIALSQRFPKSFVRWHIGVGGGRYDGLFLGISTRLNTVQSSGKGGPVSLMAEYVDDGLNLGFAINFAPGWQLDIAGVDGDLMAGIKYRGRF